MNVYSESNNTISASIISNSLADETRRAAIVDESSRSLNTVTMLNRLYELCDHATGNDPVAWDSIVSERRFFSFRMIINIDLF